MFARARSGLRLLKQTLQEFLDDGCTEMAAALAYYAMLSLAPLLVLVITITGFVLSPEQVQGHLVQQIQGMVGAQAAQQIQSMIARVQQPGHGILATVLSSAVLVFGATGMMAQLQSSLNRIWEVEPDPNQGGIKSFLLKRAFSMVMILVIAILLLGSLLLSSVVHAFGQAIAGLLSAGFSQGLLSALDVIVSLVALAVLFAGMFKILPDVKITWRQVWVGAAATAVLFVIGKTVIGIYLGSENLQATYGTAGSLVLLLVWVYYSSLILFTGAEFTQVWAKNSGHAIEPSKGAVRVEKKARIDQPHEPRGAVSGKAGSRENRRSNV